MALSISDDIFNAKYRKENVYIVHLANCVTMQRGQLAQKLFRAFGSRVDVYGKREKMLDNPFLATEDTRNKIGTIEISKGAPNVVTMFTQYMYGTAEGPHNKRTDDTKENRKSYFKICLKELEEEYLQERNDDDDDDDKVIIFPYRIGCNLGGGNWCDYVTIINEFAKKIKNVVVYIVQIKPN